MKKEGDEGRCEHERTRERESRQRAARLSVMRQRVGEKEAADR